MAGSPLTYGSSTGVLGGRRGVFRGSALGPRSFLPVFILSVLDIAGALGAAAFASYMMLIVDAQATFRQYMVGHAGYVAAFIIAWFFSAAKQQLFTAQGKERLAYQWFGVLKADLAAVIFSGFVMAFFTKRGPEPVFLSYFGVSTLVIMVVLRTIACMVAWTVHEWGLHARHVILVGVNSRTRRLVDAIASHARFGYQMVGILESEPNRLDILKDYHIPYLGKFEELERILTEQVVDEVHVCLPVRSSYERIQSIAHLCVGVGVSVRLVADLFPLRLATSRVHNLADIPMLSLSTVPESAFQLAIKRTIDIIVSSILLVLLSPVFLFFALLIKLDSKGPVFFAQERVGKNQRRFKMLKFRSMVVNAEEKRAELEQLNEADGPVFKIRRDPRITRVGRFIRKYSVDELPQLINVLKGEMSLVGPRPPLASEVVQYSWDQRRRLSVKPGMTGLWQVSGRSDVSFKEWVEMDLEYIDSWSILQDFKILFRTFGVVLHGRGAA